MNKQGYQKALMYTKAIMLLNLKQNDIQKMILELTQIAECKTPLEALKALQSNTFTKEVANFIKIVLLKKDWLTLPLVIRQLTHNYNTMANVMPVYVSSAFKLNKQEEENITNILNAKLKKQVQLFTSVDASLIDGFTVNFESYFLDFSKKAQIMKIKSCILN